MLAWFLRAYPILNSRDKRRKSLAILGFMLMSVSLIIIFSTIFSACIVYSLSLEAIPIPDDLRGAIACFIDRSGSCTGCQNTTSRCPEWSNEDVTKILQSQAKSGASLAAICLIYAVNCLRYGANLRTHISNYMIDYV